LSKGCGDQKVIALIINVLFDKLLDAKTATWMKTPAQPMWKELSDPKPQLLVSNDSLQLYQISLSNLHQPKSNLNNPKCVKDIL